MTSHHKVEAILADARAEQGVNEIDSARARDREEGPGQRERERERAGGNIEMLLEIKFDHFVHIQCCLLEIETCWTTVKEWFDQSGGDLSAEPR